MNICRVCALVEPPENPQNMKTGCGGLVAQLSSRSLFPDMWGPCEVNMTKNKFYFHQQQYNVLFYVIKLYKDVDRYTYM